MWTQARLTLYIGTAFAGLAFIAASLGFADYDAATGQVDFHPFNVWWLGGIVAGPVGSAVATVALWAGWGRK